MPDRETVWPRLDRANALNIYTCNCILVHGCILINTIEDLGKELDEQHQVDVLILDFAKALDTVPHQRMLSKLEHYGIRG